MIDKKILEEILNKINEMPLLKTQEELLKKVNEVMYLFIKTIPEENIPAKRVITKSIDSNGQEWELDMPDLSEMANGKVNVYLDGDLISATDPTLKEKILIAWNYVKKIFKIKEINS